MRNVQDNPINLGLGKKGSYYLAGGSQTGAFLEKYSANGTLQWRRNGTSSINSEYANSIGVDASGNAIIAGQIISPITFSNITLNGNIFLVKYDTTGAMLWAKTNQNIGVGSCTVMDLEVINTGHVFITGVFDSTVVFGSNAVLLSKSTSGDIFAGRFSAATGAAEWVIQAEGQTRDNSTGIAPLPNGDCIITGTYGTSLNLGNIFLSGQPTGSTYLLAKVSSNPLGVPQNNTEDFLKLYPNPAGSFVTISHRTGGSGIVEVYNSKGQKVYNEKLNKEMNIPTDKWPAGVCLVKLTSSREIVTRKLVVMP